MITGFPLVAASCVPTPAAKAARKSRYRLNAAGEVGLGLISSRVAATGPFGDQSTGRTYKIFTGDVMTRASMTAQERLQLSMQLKWGLGEVPDVFTKEFHARVMKTLLAFEALYLFLVQSEEFNEQDLFTVEKLAAAYNKQLSLTFGPDSFLNYNCNKPKMHALVHLALWLWQFGAWYNMCTSLFEAAHKRSKDHYGRTNGHEGLQSQMLAREALHSSLDSALVLGAAQRARKARCVTVLNVITLF